MKKKLFLLITCSLLFSSVVIFFIYRNNQIISHNNNNGKVNNIESVDSVDKNKDKDKNNDHKEKEEISSKKLSILKIILFLIILIIIIAIIITIVVVIKNRFKFNEESKTDFEKKIFCPTFFRIRNNKLLENSKLGNITQNGDYFFEILVNSIFSEHEKEIEKIEKIKIPLSDDRINYTINNLKGDTFLIISFSQIIAKMNTFAFRNDHYNPTSDEINFLEKNKALQNKYQNDLSNYLYSYLIYYLLETLKSSAWKDKEIEIASTKNLQSNSYLSDLVNFDIMEQILNKLLPKINIPQVTEYKPTNLYFNLF